MHHLIATLNFSLAMNRCLTFHYLMNGQMIADLNVYTEGTVVNRTQVWSRSGDKGFAWLKGYVDITPMDGLKVTTK